MVSLIFLVKSEVVRVAQRCDFSFVTIFCHFNSLSVSLPRISIIVFDTLIYSVISLISVELYGASSPLKWTNF